MTRFEIAITTYMDAKLIKKAIAIYRKAKQSTTTIVLHTFSDGSRKWPPAYEQSRLHTTKKEETPEEYKARRERIKQASKDRKLAQQRSHQAMLDNLRDNYL